jgi:hypothetical protein
LRRFFDRIVGSAGVDELAGQSVPKNLAKNLRNSSTGGDLVGQPVPANLRKNRRDAGFGGDNAAGESREESP